MKALDLFCGLGGWSDGLALEGFDVLGIDIEPKVLASYEHPFLVADVRELDGSIFKDLDLIVGSPPCRDFSNLTHIGRYKWKNPPNPQKGLDLVLAFLRIVREAKPRYWLMENVPGLVKYLWIEPRCRVRLAPSMFRCFWGNFPAFLVPYDIMRPSHQYGFKGPFRSWERARIPLPVSRALGQAVSRSFVASPPWGARTRRRP